MKQMTQRVLMGMIYGLGIVVLAWSIFLFVYQYIAAWGMRGQVAQALITPRILSALWISITTSFVTVFLAILFGVPLAYLFARKQFWGKSFLETLTIDVPQTFPPIAEGIILLLMLGPNSPFHVNIAYTYLAVVVAKFFVSAPFIVAFMARKFREIHTTDLDLIARTLGANEFQVFRTVFMPLAIKDLMAGASLCWARAMGELGGSLVFAASIPFKTEVIPTFIAQNSSDYAPALAATMLVTTASIIALVLFKALTPKGAR